MDSYFKWEGVMPAITTPFLPDLSLDLDFYRTHIKRLVEAGCTGIVVGGSLGEAENLTPEEKIILAETAVSATESRVPVILGIPSMPVAKAVGLARSAEKIGCKGLMVSAWRPDSTENTSAATAKHLSTVFSETNLPCMLYENNAYRETLISDDDVLDFALKHFNFGAIKRSHQPKPWVQNLKKTTGDRIAAFVGDDDQIVEGIKMGATGWVAGLVNALPEESVALFNLAISKGSTGVKVFYEWFYEMLRMDVVPDFVQLIKLAQVEFGLGKNELVRPPRKALTEVERKEALDQIQQAKSELSEIKCFVTTNLKKS